jgi:long-chain acyl-CoA synthetase
MANIELPNYCKLAGVEIVPEEFEKTPKRSIKRFIYQRNSAPTESN